MKSKILVAVLVMFLVLVLVGCGVVPPIPLSPVAIFTATPTSGVVPLEVYFNASNSYDPDGSIVIYVWFFEDGSTGNGQTINHTFCSIGNFDVELIVMDNQGLIDLTTELIVVEPVKF
jgi:PKD repeat protein